LDKANNLKFVRLIDGLSTILNAKQFEKILKNQIIPRLDALFAQFEQNRDEITKCICAWKVVFVFGAKDNVLRQNVMKKMKSLWKKFNAKSRQMHLFYIELLKNWKEILIEIDFYKVIVEGFVIRKVSQILMDCAAQIGKENETNKWQELFCFAHFWFLQNILSEFEYLELLANAFFDHWLFSVYERLKNANAQMFAVSIERVWNGMFAVLKNEIFKDANNESNDHRLFALYQSKQICKYLNCFLDLVNASICKMELPSFDIVKRCLLNEKVKKIKDKKSKSKKKKFEAMDANDNEQPIGIVEFVQNLAQNNGVEFYLDFGKRFDGKKVYRFGKIFISFYDQLIFAKQEGEWKPVDVNDLLQIA